MLNFTCETHVISLKLEVTIAILKEGYFQLAQFLRELLLIMAMVLIITVRRTTI